MKNVYKRYIPKKGNIMDEVNKEVANVAPAQTPKKAPEVAQPKKGEQKAAT